MREELIPVADGSVKAMLGQRGAGGGDGMRLMVSTTKGPEGQCTSEGQKRQLTLDTQVEPTDTRGREQPSTPDSLQVRRDNHPPAQHHPF